MIVTARALYNGKHYFHGEKVRGELVIKNYLFYVIAEKEDEYNNIFKTEIQVQKKSIENIDEVIK